MFFFNDTSTTEIYTLSLHDALPISPNSACGPSHRADVGSGWTSTMTPSAPTAIAARVSGTTRSRLPPEGDGSRSEEHTSELQSRQYLVCRLLLEKKKLIL